VIRGHSLEEIVDAGLAHSVRSLQDQIRAKKIPAHKRGRHWILTDTDLETALDIWASKTGPQSVPALRPLSLTPTSMRRRAS
jgi:hypothetical protein